MSRVSRFSLNSAWNLNEAMSICPNVGSFGHPLGHLRRFYNRSHETRPFQPDQWILNTRPLDTNIIWFGFAGFFQFIHQVLTSGPCIDKLLSLSRLSFTDWWLLMKSVSSFSRLKFYYDVICADLPLLYFQNGKGFCQSCGRSWFVHSKQGSFVNVFVILLQAWSSSTSFTNPCHAAMFILCSCFAPRFICAAPCKYFWKHLGWSDRRGLLVRSDVGASLFHRRHFGSRQAAIFCGQAKGANLERLCFGHFWGSLFQGPKGSFGERKVARRL